MTSHRLRTRVVGALAASFLAVTMGAIGAVPASAHSQVTSTSPADGAVLAVPPDEVRITFDSPLIDDTDTISINDEYGNVVKSIHPKPEGYSVAIPWPAGTPAGTYQVAYRVVCGDGQPVIGALAFSVDSATPSAVASASAGRAPASAAASTPASAAAVVAADEATPPSDGSSGSLAPMIIGGAILLAGAVALVFAIVIRRRGTPAPTTTA